MYNPNNLPDGYELLQRICRRVDESQDLTQLIRPVLEEVRLFLPGSRLAVSLFHRDSGEITMEEVCGLDEQQRRQGRFRLGEGIIGKALATGQSYVLQNVHQHPDFLDRLQDTQGLIQPALVCVPIIQEGRVMGVLSCIWEHAGETEAVATRLEQLLSVIASLLAGAVCFRQLLEDKLRLQNQLRETYRPQNIIGNSKAIRVVYQQIAQVCQSDTTVLLRGESGVGKELVASAIHYASRRANGPLISVNCSAIPETLLETELFGHERGAFTGAVRQRKGRFEQAHGGTLFLDEIGDISPAMQVKLLRVLQERELQRVGGDRSIQVDVRVIAASNRDLEAAMRTEQFRPDLFYRLSVFPIHIPPLRERKEDISTLADFFVAKYNKNAKETIRRISTPALNALITYPWPGNVRELQNCIERAVLVAEGHVITEHDLPPSLQTAATSDTRSVGSLEAILASHERELICDAIVDSRGNIAQAARMLGITERQMGYRIKTYGIDPKTYR